MILFPVEAPWDLHLWGFLLSCSSAPVGSGSECVHSRAGARQFLATERVAIRVMVFLGNNRAVAGLKHVCASRGCQGHAEYRVASQKGKPEGEITRIIMLKPETTPPIGTDLPIPGYVRSEQRFPMRKSTQANVV